MDESSASSRRVDFSFATVQWKTVIGEADPIQLRAAVDWVGSNLTGRWSFRPYRIDGNSAAPDRCVFVFEDASDAKSFSELCPFLGNATRG